MKKSDLSMVIIIAAISVLVAFILSNSLLTGIKQESVSVKTIDSYSSEFIKPDKKVFYSGAINPTVDVIVDPENPE